MLLKFRQLAGNSRLKRLAVRALRYAPAVDTWLRTVISLRLYKPSSLQVKADELPEIAQTTYRQLLAAVRRR